MNREKTTSKSILKWRQLRRDGWGLDEIAADSGCVYSTVWKALCGVSGRLAKPGHAQCVSINGESEYRVGDSFPVTRLVQEIRFGNVEPGVSFSFKSRHKDGETRQHTAEMRGRLFHRDDGMIMLCSGSQGHWVPPTPRNIVAVLNRHER